MSLPPDVLTKMDRFARRVAVEELSRVAKALCKRCAKGEPVGRIPGGYEYGHGVPAVEPEDWLSCEAGMAVSRIDLLNTRPLPTIMGELATWGDLEGVSKDGP